MRLAGSLIRGEVVRAGVRSEVAALGVRPASLLPRLLVRGVALVSRLGVRLDVEARSLVRAGVRL